MLFLDGVYVVTPSHSNRPRFQWVREPTSAQLTQLTHTIAHRVGRLLEREGLVERDTEQLDSGEVLDENDPMPDRSVIPSPTALPSARTADARSLRFRPCRTAAGKMRWPARPEMWPAFRCTPGSRSKPLNATNLNGCAATSAARRGAKPTKPAPTEDRTPAEQRAAMRWAQRLKRVFQIDVETCPNCGGTVRIIVCIEDPPVIERILRHLAGKDLPGLWPQTRAPPAACTGLHH